MSRPSLDKTFIEIAELWALRSTCPRGSVGCVAASPEGRLLASGYNGAPKGLRHCADVGCLIEGGHCVRAIHAEANMIVTAGRHGVPLDGATVYTTMRPCARCARLLIQAGVAKVAWRRSYDSDDFVAVLTVLSEAGVEMEVMA